MAKIPAIGYAVGGAVLAGAGGYAKHREQKKLIETQQDANDDWLAFQQQQKARAAAAEVAQRKQASASLDDYLQTIRPERRAEDIADRGEERAEATFGAAKAAPEVATMDVLTPGQAKSGAVLSDASRKMNAATKQARDRIRAGAEVAAYGDHFAGDARALGGVNQDIAMINDRRAGNIRTLQGYQAVQPEIFGHQSTGVAELMQTAGGLAMGHGMGTMFPVAGGINSGYSGLDAATRKALAALQIQR